ncbi:MAG: formate/nitrite transporter family protein [Coprobacter sp.]|nr:formate/nitrite transporter family protein [Coprobacter sp.]
MHGMATHIIKSVLAGFTIGIGSIMYLRTGGVAGAVLFAFGLIVIVHYGWNLFTGQAGFSTRPGFLALVLGFNIVGCWMASLLVAKGMNPIVETRLATGWADVLLRSAGCGFIMTASVRWAREDKWLPLLFGVPVFILCGFPHCIADVVYYLSCPTGFLREHAGEIVRVYALTVAGNFIGCNLYRVENLGKKSETA